MAPEILRGERYDAKVDLWSIGCILHEMLYGRPPFKAGNHIDLLKKIERGDGTLRFPGEDIYSSSNRYGTAQRSTPPQISSQPHKVSSRQKADDSDRPQSYQQMIQRPRTSAQYIQSPDAIKIVSEDLRDMMHRLLKRVPRERIEFVDFFNHPSFFISRPVDTMPIQVTRRISSDSSKSAVSSPAHQHRQYSLSSSPQTHTEGHFVPTSRRTDSRPNSLSSSYKRQDLTLAIANKRSSRDSLISPKLITSLFNETSSGIAKLSTYLPRIPFFGQKQQVTPTSEEFVFVDKSAVEINLTADSISGTSVSTSISTIDARPPALTLADPKSEHLKTLLETFAQCGMRAYAIHSLIKNNSLLPEEVFGLCMLNMGLYQQCMDVAKIIWDGREGEGEWDEFGKGVGWVRDQFNHCLEMASLYKDKKSESGYAHTSHHSKLREARYAVNVVYDAFLDISYQSATYETRGMGKQAADGYQRCVLLLEAVLAARNIFDDEADNEQFMMRSVEYAEVESDLRELQLRLLEVNGSC